MANTRVAVFRFSQGLEAGVNSMRWGPDGALYIGGVGMVGGWSWKEKQYGFQKLKYNGKPVFEMLAVGHSRMDLTLSLPSPLSDGQQIFPADLLVQQWWYLPTCGLWRTKKGSSAN